MFWRELMRILVRQSQFCSGSAGWHFCWESLNHNHNLHPWMQKWWESQYDIQNFENWNKKTRWGTQVGQNETRLTPREASKSESQKRSATTYTPQKLLAKFHPNVLSFFVDPPSTERSLKKWISSIAARSLVLWIANQWSARATTTKQLDFGGIQFPRNKHLSHWSGSQWSTRATRRGRPVPTIIFH